MTPTVGMTPAPSNEIIGHRVGILGQVHGTSARRLRVTRCMRPGCCARWPTSAGCRRARCWRAPRSSPADLDNPDTMVSAARRDHCGAPAAGPASGPTAASASMWAAGPRLPTSGLFGFAVMSCGTLRELFSIAMRYFALTTMHIRLTLFETADDCLSSNSTPATCPRMCRDSSSNVISPESSRLQRLSRCRWRRSMPTRFRRNWRSTRNCCGRC